MFASRPCLGFLWGRRWRRRRRFGCLRGASTPRGAVRPRAGQGGAASFFSSLLGALGLGSFTSEEQRSAAVRKPSWSPTASRPAPLGVSAPARVVRRVMCYNSDGGNSELSSRLPLVGRFCRWIADGQHFAEHLDIRDLDIRHLDIWNLEIGHLHEHNKNCKTVLLHSTRCPVLSRPAGCFEVWQLHIRHLSIGSQGQTTWGHHSLTQRHTHTHARTVPSRRARPCPQAMFLILRFRFIG